MFGLTSSISLYLFINDVRVVEAMSKLMPLNLQINHESEFSKIKVLIYDFHNMADCDYLYCAFIY